MGSPGLKLRTVTGIHACREALKVHHKQVVGLYLKPGWESKKSLKALKTHARGIKTQVMSAQKMDKIGPGHQGAVLLLKGRPRLNLPDPLLLKTVLVYLDRVEDPRNLGSVLRSSWLMGVKGLLLPSKGSVGLTPSVMKVAAGGAEHVPVEFVSSPVHHIQSLKRAGFSVYGLSREGKKSLWKQDFSGPSLFVVGSEEKGIRLTVKSLCDELLFIPQAYRAAHFNLSHAVVLALNECLRSQNKF